MEKIGAKFFLQKGREQTVIWVHAIWPTAIYSLWQVPHETEESWCQITPSKGCHRNLSIGSNVKIAPKLKVKLKSNYSEVMVANTEKKPHWFWGGVQRQNIYFLRQFNSVVSSGLPSSLLCLQTFGVSELADIWVKLLYR